MNIYYIILDWIVLTKPALKKLPFDGPCRDEGILIKIKETVKINVKTATCPSFKQSQDDSTTQPFLVVKLF